MKADIYSKPSDPIQEYEYPLERISKNWTLQIANYLTLASTNYINSLKSASDTLDHLPLPEVPDFLKNIPTNIKKVHDHDEDLIPNMGYVFASGAGSSIFMKKSGIIARVLVPTTAVLGTFYFLYPKTSGNIIKTMSDLYDDKK
jgi:hypothetical protein